MTNMTPRQRSQPSLIIWLAACLMTFDAQAAQPERTATGLTQARLADQTISLSNQQGRCTLTHADNVAVTLDMKWPCRFSEDRQKKVRIEDYRKALVVMVERSEPLPAPSQDCATDLQSVRLYKGKLEISPVSRVAGCGPAHWDQKALIWNFDW